ncbi:MULTISPECIES: sugar-transfer associated ATP-grasp domain-containing protein [unclassified Marinovum]
MSNATLTAGFEAGALVERDQQSYQAKHEYNKTELIAHAARAAGRGAFGIGIEAAKLRKGRQKIELDEYVKFRLYDPAAHSEQERGEFISWLLQNPIIHEVNDLHWFAVTEDKWLSSKLLEADGLPVPDTLGVIDSTGRAYHGTQPFDGPEALRAAIGGGLEAPLFGKNMRGLGSVGVFTITAADCEGLALRDHGEMSYDHFFASIIGEHAFLLQKFVSNCGFLRDYTDTTATVRMVNMVDGDGIYVPAAVLKLPSQRNQADNFWRDGNMLCSIDPETGEVLTLVQSEGPELVHIERPPETGKEIIGSRLPHWEALRAVNERVARLHAPLRYQSTDIALTDEGPVVIEVNAGSSFTLPQYASGKGFMTPKVRQLFRSWGSKIVWE